MYIIRDSLFNAEILNRNTMYHMHNLSFYKCFSIYAKLLLLIPYLLLVLLIKKMLMMVLILTMMLIHNQSLNDLIFVVLQNQLLNDVVVIFS